MKEELLDPGHKVCAYENKHFGGWEKRKMGSPYDWFFNYYQLDTVDSVTGKKLGARYNERTNKLDKLFGAIAEWFRMLFWRFDKKAQALRK